MKQSLNNTTLPTTTGSAFRYAPIDALRGIAALLVVWQHTSESLIKIPGIALHNTFLADISAQYDFGRIGIICFFLISGFVIPSSLKTQTTNKKTSISHFAKRRFYRLYPAYWLSLLLMVLILPAASQPSSWTIIANATMLQSFFSQAHVIGLYWTLQVELIFYGICALLFYFQLLHNNRFIFFVIVGFFSVFVAIESYPLLSQSNLTIAKEFQLMPYLISIMFLGSLYRKIYDGNTGDKNVLLYTSIATFLCLGLPVFLWLSSLLGYSMIEHSFRFGVANSLAFVLFFSGLYFLKKPAKILIWLGTISYSIYLFHPIIMQLVKKLIWIAPSSFPILPLSVYMLITTLISIVFAHFIYSYFEKPAIVYSKKQTQSSES